MTRLKLSLKNSARAAFLFLLNFLFCLNLTGCQNPIEPTYKEENIPAIVKKICKEEYNLEVTTKRTPTTLWIYAALNQILDKDYGKKEGKIFDEGMIDKLRNILMTVGRVLISSDNTPEFFALLTSDIKLGLDYTLIGNTLDIKKSYANFIPWTEANRRYVIKLELNPAAIGDNSAAHLNAYDIKLPDFLADQIAQRIGASFQAEDLKKYFKVEKCIGAFSNNTFGFEYSIQKVSSPPKEIDIQKEILDTVTYCLRTYEFTDFTTVELKDLLTQDKLLLNRAVILGRPL